MRLVGVNYFASIMSVRQLSANCCEVVIVARGGLDRAGRGGPRRAVDNEGHDAGENRNNKKIPPIRLLSHCQFSSRAAIGSREVRGGGVSSAGIVFFLFPFLFFFLSFAAHRRLLAAGCYSARCCSARCFAVNPAFATRAAVI